MKTFQFTITCPKCDSTNTAKNGRSASGKEMVRCRDCGKYSTLGRLPKLTDLICKSCGKTGVNSRKSMLCINCYLRENPSKYQYKSRIRQQPLSQEEKDYFKDHLDELPIKLNITMKQLLYFKNNPEEWDKQVKYLLS